MDSEKNEREVLKIDDSDLGQVSGGWGYWVPSGHDSNDRYVLCPLCRDDGMPRHEFWVRTWGNNIGRCKKHLSREFPINEDIIIHLKPGDTYNNSYE